MQDRVDRSDEDLAGLRRAVLIVEDEFLLRWPASEHLRESGYRVIEVASVAEAILVLSCGSPVDIVFSDVNLNGKETGHTLARWLERHRPGMPLLLTSGDGAAAGLLNNAANHAFVAKPYVLAEISRRLGEMLSRNER